MRFWIQYIASTINETNQTDKKKKRNANENKSRYYRKKKT